MQILLQTFTLSPEVKTSLSATSEETWVFMFDKSPSTSDPPTTLSFRLFFFFPLPTSSRDFFVLPFFKTDFFLSLSLFVTNFFEAFVFFRNGGGVGDLAFRRLFDVEDTGYGEADRLKKLKDIEILT